MPSITHCAECGTAVEHQRQGRRRKFCSACRPSKRDPKPMERWNCGQCGALCERHPTRGQRPKWCQDCRRSIYEKRNPDRPCAVCRKPVVRRATYCSLDCAAAARRTTSRQVVLYTGPKFMRTPKPNLNPVPRSKRRFRSARCIVCTASFITLNTDVTCSSVCQVAHYADAKRRCKERRRAAKRNAYVADVYRRKVYEADGYRCHICNRKTNPDKQVPHPRAPTLDHVIPLSKGGTHEPSNVRTACFLCNALKSDGGGGEQFALAL